MIKDMISAVKKNMNEEGAWDRNWTPRGYTKPGGVIETVIDSVPKNEYVLTENILKKQ